MQVWRSTEGRGLFVWLLSSDINKLSPETQTTPSMLLKLRRTQLPTQSKVSPHKMHVGTNSSRWWSEAQLKHKEFPPQICLKRASSPYCLKKSVYSKCIWTVTHYLFCFGSVVQHIDFVMKRWLWLKCCLSTLIWRSKHPKQIYSVSNRACFTLSSPIINETKVIIY